MCQADKCEREADCQTNPTKKYHMSMHIYLINKIKWWIHGREYQRWIKLTGIVELFTEWKVAKPQIYHEPCDNHRRWINSITKLTRRVYSNDKWNWIHLQGRTYIMIINDMIEDKSNHRSEWMSNIKKCRREWSIWKYFKSTRYRMVSRNILE
jgi:hypothetical protein